MLCSLITGGSFPHTLQHITPLYSGKANVVCFAVECYREFTIKVEITRWRHPCNGLPSTFVHRKRVQRQPVKVLQWQKIFRTTALSYFFYMFVLGLFTWRFMAMTTQLGGLTRQVSRIPRDILGKSRKLTGMQGEHAVILH